MTSVRAADDGVSDGDSGLADLEVLEMALQGGPIPKGKWQRTARNCSLIFSEDMCLLSSLSLPHQTTTHLS